MRGYPAGSRSASTGARGGGRCALRSLCTSLGAWDTIEGVGKHSLTFPLAIVSQVMAEAGYPRPVCWKDGTDTRARDVDLLLVSAMDSRHFWRLGDWLREVGCPLLAVDRGESDPIVIVGGQAATAPAPIEHMADVVYIGEAEAELPALLDALRHGPRASRLERAASVPGCLVPSMLPVGHVVRQVYADDIGISLRHQLQVNIRRLHRVELARGCRHKCGFCCLGWRSRYRESRASDVLDALASSRAVGVTEAHLSCADSESHSEIVALRVGLDALGIRDHGWTGRLDSLHDDSITAGKLYAPGVEGMSWRLRRAIGKPRLTDDYIVERVGDYWRAGGRRLVLHMIGGLPTESDEDAAAFADLLCRLEQITTERQHVTIGRQPFGPLPHTPMQWCAPGLSTERIGRVTARYAGGARLNITDTAGQPYGQALLNALVMRGGREVQPLVTAGAPPLPRDHRRAMMRWRSWVVRAGLDPMRYLGAWSPGEPTPWAHVESAYHVGVLHRAHAAIMRRLRTSARSGG